MEHRNSREMAAPGHRTLSGTRRTAMRVMHRKSVGIMAVYEQDPVAAEAGTRMLVFESPSRCTRVANFPAEWQRFRAGVPEADRDGDLVAAYARLMEDPQPEVRARAAADWMAWEDAVISLEPSGKPKAYSLL